jgi:DNA ligase-1
MSFAPTLAQSYAGGELPFPLYASLKLDGVRAYCKDGNVLSRKLIHIPNRFVQTVFSDLRLNNLEGELIVGKPNEHETFQRTSGAVRRFEDEPDVTLNVFDVAMVACFEDRLNYIKSLPVMPRVKVIDQVLINCNDELVAFKDKAFKDKYEGKQLTNAEKFESRLLRLPLHSDVPMEYVASRIIDFFKSK